MEVEREEDAAHGLASEGLILICYIHGFKGNDETFEQFPKRILYSLSQTFGAKMHIDSVIYPAYRTAGKLEDAVVLFKEWLVALTAEKEEAFMLAQQKETVRGGNAAATWQDRTQAKVVLMGHSMGGLVAADTVLSIRAEYEAAKIGLWPRIVGVLAFDTPYLGLNPRTFSNTADQYIDHATKAHDTIRDLTGFSLGSIWGTAGKGPEQRSSDALTRKEDTASTSSWWSAKTAGALGGTALAAAAAGLAWSQRSAISSLGVNSWDFLNSHLEFVGALWKKEDLQRRLEAIVDLETVDRNSAQPQIGFHCIYTQIPDNAKYKDRTFAILPIVNNNSPLGKRQRSVRQRFTANTNTQAANEVDA